MKDNGFSAEALEAQNNPEMISGFIEKNLDFIKYSAYKAVGRFITQEDDEYSIALSAFLESVESFNPAKGAFSSFSQLVIKRRLLDYINACNRHEQELVIEPGLFEGNIDQDNVDSLSFELRDKSVELSLSKETILNRSVTIKDEIDAISDTLNEYGFCFMDLTKCSPTAKKTKALCAKVINTILSSESLLSKLKKQKSDALAQEAYLSKYYLMRRFKAATGYSLHRYVTMKRLLHARSLLTESPERAITEISADSGFTDYTAFFRAFKTQFSVTPQEWRKLHIGK